MARPWWELDEERGGVAEVGSRATGRPGRARVGGAVEPRATARGGVGWAPGDRPWWETAGGAGRGGGGVPGVGAGQWQPPRYTGFEGAEPREPTWMDRVGEGVPFVEGLSEAMRQWEPPGWMRRVGDWAYEIARPMEERLGEAWRAPMERPGMPTIEEPPSPREVFELAQGAALAEGATEEDAYRAGGRAQLEAMTEGTSREDLLRWWSAQEQKPGPLGEVARRIGQVGGVGLEAMFVEPAIATKQVPAAALLETAYDAGDLSPRELAPVARTMGSAEWQDIRRRAGEIGERVKAGDLRALAELGPGGSDTVREALERIREGEDAESVVAEYEDPMVEMAVEALTDPLNVFDLMGMEEAARVGRQLSEAEQLVARTVDDIPEARRAVEETARAMRASGQEAEQALRVGAEVVGEGDRQGFISRVGQKLREPFELVPEAKAERDMGEVWVVLGGPMSEARSGEEALGLMRQWAEDPGALRGRYGRTVESRAGRKAQAVFSEILEEAEKLPSVRDPEFNPAQFVVELEELALGRLREGYGAKEPGRYLRFANAWKGLQSEFYLTAAFSPGYVARNTASDLFTSAVDGLATFEKAGDIDRYLGDLGEVTTRRATTGGKGAREALTGLVEGESRLPGVLGTISKKGQEITRYGEPLGRLPIGEEPRYRRALYKGVRRFLDQNALQATPKLPGRVRVAMGRQAEDLVEAVARGMNPEAKRAAVERVLGATSPGQGIEPAKYLDLETMDAMSPEMYGRLRERLGELPADAGPDALMEVFEEARGWVDEFEGKALVDEGEAVVPGRKVASDVEEAEIADAVLIELRGALERAGVGADEVERLVGNVQARMDELERLLDAARAQAGQAAGDAVRVGAAPEDALEVMMAANRDVDRMRDGVRKDLGELMQEARAAYREDPGRGAEIWPAYFQQVAQGWEAAAGERIGRFGQAVEQLVELGAGARLEDVLGMDRRALAEARLRHAVVPEELALPLKEGLPFEPGSVLDAEDTAKFDAFLAARRRQVDVAQGQAWRRGFGAGGEQYGDVLDLLDSAGRDVEFYGKRAAAEVAIAREAMLDEVASLQASKPRRWKAKVKRAATDYYKERNRLWSGYFEQARDRWIQAEVDVGRLPGAARAGGGPAAMPRGAEPAAVTAPGGRVARTTPEGMRSGVMNPEGTATVRYREPAEVGGRWEVDYIGGDGKVLETRTVENEGEARRLAEMGEREASLRARAVPSGEESVVGLHQVPEGAVVAEVRKDGRLWKVEYVDPTGRVLESYDFGRNYPAAKAARNRARRIIERRARTGEAGALAEGAGAAPSAAGVEEVAGEGAQRAAPVQEGEDWMAAAGVPEEMRQGFRESGVTPEEWDWMRQSREAELAANRANRVPGDVEEAARQFGYRPEEMGEEEWLRLAVDLRGDAGYAMERSTPEGLDALASRAAHTGGKEWMEIGGYSREVRSRALTRAQEAEYRRGLMGVYADEPRFFYERQRALADWYYDLADDAEVMAGRGRVEERVLPEALLRTSTGAEDAERVLQKAVGELEQARLAVAETEGRIGAGAGEFSRTEVSRRKRARTRAEKELEDLIQRVRGEARGDDPYVQAALEEAEKAIGQGGGRGAYNEAVAEAGAGEAPGRAELVQVTAEATRRGLDQMEAGLVGEWDAWRPVVEDAAMRRGVQRWLNDEVLPAWFETRATALQYGKNAADFAVLNYRNRRKFDVWLSYVAPYSYWYTRSGWNWAQRLAGRPGMLSQYLRARRAMKLANENAGRRARFERKVRVPFPWLPDWMGDGVYVDPLRFVVPFAAYERTDWDDPEESRKGLRAVFGGLEKLGLRPYHFLELPYKAGWLRRGGEALGMAPEQAEEYLGPGMEGEFGFFLPQTRAIRSATAMGRELAPEAMGWVPPGGVNVEAPLRRMMGLPAGEVWDPYRVGRTLANMAAERAEDYGFARAALMGQELLRRDEDQAGRVWDAGSPLAQQVAAEMGWTGEELAAAQGLLQEAMQRTALEQGVGSVGWALGPGLSVEPTGERARLELAEQARGMGWAPTGEAGRLAEGAGAAPSAALGGAGTRAGYEAFREQYPALEVHGAQYGLVPGEEEGYTPGMRLTNLEVSRRRDEINAEYDRRVDALLRERPGDDEGRRALEAERTAALAGVREYMGGDFPEVPAGELPEMRYGESPVEYGERVALDEARSVRDLSPKPEDYTDSAGEIDWGAFYADYDGWLEGLPESTERLAALRALGGKYAGLSLRELVEAYGQRYDSPLEAVARVYRDEVVGGAWDEYREVQAEDERRWPGMRELEGRYFELDAEGRRALMRENPGLGDYWDYKEREGSAYDRTVGRLGEVEAGDLISLVLQTYKAKGWTPEELGREYEGVVFPAYAAQQAAEQVSSAGAEEPAEAAKEAAPSAPRDGGARGGGGESEYRWMWPGGEGYEEAVERVGREGWRAVYGEPWWEKYGLVGRAGSWGRGGRRGGTGGYSGGRWIPAGRSYWDRWRPPSRLYGGPFRS